MAKQVKYASFWRRLLSFVIDFSIGAFLGSYGFVLIGFSDAPRPDPTYSEVFFGFILIIVLLIYMTIVPVLSIKLFGRTIGDFISRIRVVDEQGNKPGWIQSIVRYVVFVILYCIQPFGQIAIVSTVIFTRKKQAPYDMIAGTYVIKS